VQNLIICLSSIPSRFASLKPTLNSLLRQRLPASEIRLHIPHSYRRFPDWDGTLPDVPAGITIVRAEHDYGPATKILPATKSFRGQNVELLLCDDDRTYDSEWTARFIEERKRRPDYAIAEDGRNIPGYTPPAQTSARLHRKDWKYRLIRTATLGRHRPPIWAQAGHIDIFKGYAGVLLRPDFLPDFAYDIPDILWTVDDVWLSGCMASNGIGIWVNANAPRSAERRVANRDSLLRMTFKNHNRSDANDACWTWFQTNKGIWL